MNNIILKPTAANIIRYQLVNSLIIMPVAMGLTMLFLRSPVAFSWRDRLLYWIALSSAGIFGALLGQLMVLKKSVESLSIIISDGYLLGPGLWVWQRNRLEIGKLDKAKSIRRSLYKRLFRKRSLWSQNGEKIEICDPFYGKVQIEKLLEVLQLKN
jgi:hypothetical protein